MKVLIVGLNYAPEKVGIAVYTAGMAEALVAYGQEVRVVAGQPYYPAWKIMDGHSAFFWSSRTENGVRVTRVPHYVPAHPTGVKRLIHHTTFALSALVPTIWTALTFQPDIVMTVAPSLIGAPVARLAAWLRGAESWLHIQDFEVEAAFATGLINGESRVAGLARAFESWVLKSFGRVTSISPTMCHKLVDKGVPRSRVGELRNWTDIDVIRPMNGPSPFRAEWGIDTEHVALYSGSIANKQGIEIVLHAAQKLQHRRDLTFVVCGEGPNRDNLERQASGLCNIQFHQLQPKERLNDLLGLATVHLLPQIAGAADLVLPSKLTNMLASGRPVVATAERGSGLYQELDGCGVLVMPGDSAGFADAIEQLLNDEAAATGLGVAARHRAEESWAKDVVLGQLGSAFEALGATKSGLAQVRE